MLNFGHAYTIYELCRLLMLLFHLCVNDHCWIAVIIVSAQAHTLFYQKCVSRLYARFHV